MREEVADFVPFDETYEATDWSMYEDMPTLDASNRSNVFGIYLAMAAKSFH